MTLSPFKPNNVLSTSMSTPEKQRIENVAKWLRYFGSNQSRPVLIHGGKFK